MTNPVSPPDRQLAATAATATIIGGLAWIALAVDSILRSDPRDYRDALFLGPWVLYAATLACIHRLQRHRAGRLERWGFTVVIVSAALVMVGSVGHILGVEGLELVSFPIGALLWTLGMIAFGAGTARAGQFSGRIGWAIALSQPLTIAISTVAFSIMGLEPEGWGSYPGVIGHGAVMLLLAATLRDASRSTDTAGRRFTGADA